MPFQRLTHLPAELGGPPRSPAAALPMQTVLQPEVRDVTPRGGLPARVRDVTPGGSSACGCLGGCGPANLVLLDIEVPGHVIDERFDPPYPNANDHLLEVRGCPEAFRQEVPVQLTQVQVECLVASISWANQVAPFQTEYVEAVGQAVANERLRDERWLDGFYQYLTTVVPSLWESCVGFDSEPWILDVIRATVGQYSVEVRGGNLFDGWWPVVGYGVNDDRPSSLQVSRVCNYPSRQRYLGPIGLVPPDRAPGFPRLG